MKTLNIAIAGAGYSSRVFHIPFLKNDRRFIIKKVYERTENKAQAWLPDADIVRDYNALLTAEIDLVIIATPNQTHYEMVKSALSAGKNVLVEKPLAASAEQALKLAALAKTQGLVLSVYQNRRWDSAIATAKRILAHGLIGDPVDCEIRFDRYAKGKNVKAWKETGEKGTGLVYDLGVHMLDQALYLFGNPAEIFADIRYQHEGALSDDNFDIHLYYPSGLRVTAGATKYARESGNHFTLHGKLGSYVKPKIDIQESLLAKGIVPQGDWNAEPITDWGILHSEINGETIRQSYPDVNTSYQYFYDNLYSAMTENQPLAVTAEQAAQVLHLIEKAFESAETGCRIKL